MRSIISSKALGINKILSRYCSTTSVESRKIQIPTYIKRGPTDVLKALSGTVGRDVTAPLYKYHDDPYLIPHSAIEKKIFSLSKESGRKAARWIRNKHFAFFRDQVDDPVIEDFIPKMGFEDAKAAPSEDMLRLFIHNCQVPDAVLAYKGCRENKIEVKPELQQSLLELLCLYNEEEVIHADWQEELFQKTVTNDMRILKTWKAEGLAEELFIEMGEPTEEAYCTMIRGTCCHHDNKRAYELYNEALSKGFQLDTETFNALIRITPAAERDSNSRWDLARSVVAKMVEHGAKPNVSTLNALLEVVSYSPNWSQAGSTSLSIISEFSKMGIQPTLASYYHLVRVHYGSKSRSVSGILFEIIEELEISPETFELQDKKDVSFFFRAMEICCFEIADYSLAQRIHKLLMTNNNMRFMGEYGREAMYFRNFMKMAINNLSLDEFMEVYDEYVPNLYTPDRDVMSELVKAIGVHGQLSLMPRVWSDVIRFNMSLSEIVISLVLTVLDTQVTGHEDAKLLRQLQNIPLDIWTRVQGQKQMMNMMEWTGQILSDLISTLVKTDAEQLVTKIMREAEENTALTVGELTPPALELTFKYAMTKNNTKLAESVLKYAKSCGMPEYEKMQQEFLGRPDTSSEDKASTDVQS